jgi:hypothetical protein
MSEQDIAVAKAEKAYEKARKSKPGAGKRFEALSGVLESKGAAEDPGALAAWIGRRKFGPKRFKKLAK